MKKKIAVAVLSGLMTLSLTSIGFTAGSVGHGNMSVFEGGQLVDKLSGQNPISESSLLVCDGKCMVKSEGISLVAADQAKFAIQNEDAVFNLFVKSGKIDFVINDNTRKIAFHTPEGTYTVADVIFDAGSSSVVKGSVQITEAGKTEIYVTEGRLVFATGDGMKPVDADHKIVLAIGTVPEDGAGVAAGAGGAGLSTRQLVTGGVVVAGAIIAAIIINNNNDDDDVPSPAASSAPAPVVGTNNNISIPSPSPRVASPNN